MARHMAPTPQEEPSGRADEVQAGAPWGSDAPQVSSPYSRDTYVASVRGARPRSKGRVGRIIAGLLIFAIGAAIFLFPTVSELLAQREARQTIASALAAGVSDTPASDDASVDPNAKRAKDTDPAYQWLLAYNERVAAGQGGAINDPWGIGSDNDELSQVGLAGGIVGSLTISSLGEQLPLYLGSSMDHLAGGVAVISGTDAPLGQTGSNCVIAGHRAKWSGLTMFRDIENVREGDTVDIETPWDSLTYRVVGFRVIDPTNEAEVKDICAIQPGRDLVTLVTCHPYGHNYQRYVVTCERVDTGTSGVTGTGDAQQGTGPSTGIAGLLARNPVSEALQPSASPILVVERWLRVAGLALMILVVVLALVDLVRAVAGRR